MIMNAKGLQLLKDFEGCRLEAYLCPAGVATLGFGSTGPHVRMGMKITMAEAEELLRSDLAPREASLSALLGRAETTSDQYSAMLSLLYNIGEANFAKSSVLRFHKAGDYAGAAKAFRLWNKAKIRGQLMPLKGLTRRRAEEARLYLGEL